jgi:hypothetical protein
VKAVQQADAINTNINFFISIFLPGNPRVFELTTLNVYTAADNGLVLLLSPNRLTSRMLAFFALGWR